MRRARSVRELDDPAQRSAAVADPARLLEGPSPVLLDEWRHVPETWDLVRRAVDRGAAPGSFLLTGSAQPNARGSHSGAARIVSVRMRPLALCERGLEPASVSVADLLSGGRPRIAGASSTRLGDYVREIVSSGFPGIRTLPGRARGSRHPAAGRVLGGHCVTCRGGSGAGVGRTGPMWPGCRCPSSAIRSPSKPRDPKSRRSSA